MQFVFHLYNLFLISAFCFSFMQFISISAIFFSFMQFVFNSEIIFSFMQVVFNFCNYFPLCNYFSIYAIRSNVFTFLYRMKEKEITARLNYNGRFQKSVYVNGRSFAITRVEVDTFSYTVLMEYVKDYLHFTKLEESTSAKKRVVGSL